MGKFFTYQLRTFREVIEDVVYEGSVLRGGLHEDRGYSRLSLFESGEGEGTLDDVLDDRGLGRTVDVVKDTLDGVGEEVVDDVGVFVGTVDAVEGDSSVIARHYAVKCKISPCKSITGESSSTHCWLDS